MERGWNSGIDRRRFLTILGARRPGDPPARLSPRLAYADTLTKTQRDKMTPEEIIAVLKQGNERFRKPDKLTPNYIAQQKGLGQ